MFDMGTSNNQLNSTQQNSINNDLTFMFGDGNKGGAKEYGGATQSNEQSRKDEMGLSASVGVGIGGDGSGGLASLERSGDSQLVPQKTDYIKYLVIGGGVLTAIIGLLFAFKMLKKKK